MHSITEQSWNPENYDRVGAFVPRLGSDLIDLLAPKPGERVLDLGCGTGDLTAQLAAAGARPLGLDASSAMVEAARHKHPNLTFVVGDGQALTYQTEFDAVFSSAALHWMPRAEDVASGVARALRAGGRFVAELGGARNVLSVRRAVEDELAARGLAGYEAPGWFFPSVASYARILDQAGLFVHSAVWFERPTRLAGEGGLSGWLGLFCEPLLRALGELRPAVVRGVEQRCRAQLFRDGDWWLDYTRLRVTATKP